MKKDLGAIRAIYPMPVLMIATYNEDGSVNVMNAAWGMINDYDEISICVDHSHKTMENILSRKAFTVSLADRAHMKEADYFGIVSGNDVPDKFARSGLHAVKSRYVDAPIVTEFPVVMECELVENVVTEHLEAVVGKILNTAAEEAVLDERGEVDVLKLNALIFDSFRSGYYVSAEKVGQAWDAGASLC